jgi:putative glutamine amidotransferase
MTRPRIGVLCNHSDGDGGPFSERQLVNQAYLDRLEEAGAACLLIHDTSDEMIVALMEMCDGLLVTGGADFDPRAYGRQPQAKLGSVNPRRDHIDSVAVSYALERPELPMLGICRGIQSINVIAGGTLLQDVTSEVEDALKHAQSAPGWYGTHDITIAEGSRLREILGAERVAVNSYHHQAVDDPAPGFSIVARTDDGVAEAIERDEADFCIGLQFHPEVMAHRNEQLAGIFAAFVAACR